MNEKEKATLLDSTQRSFFKTTSTKEAAAAIILEKSMDETNMDGGISNEIATENKAIRGQIRKLKTMIRCASINDYWKQQSNELRLMDAGLGSKQV